MRSVDIIKFLAVPICISILIQCAENKQDIELSQGSSFPAVAAPGTGPAPSTVQEDTNGAAATPAPGAGATPQSGDAEASAPKLDNFRLLSTAFKNLQPLPPEFSAKSPPFSWSGPPAGTGSFAIQMVDIDAVPPLVLWTIINIPLDSTKIPGSIPTGNNLLEPKEAAGANQPNPYKGPSPADQPHRIEVTLYAILPNIGLRIAKDAAANKSELETKSVGKVVLTGIFD